jgi:hypothetical protein
VADHASTRERERPPPELSSFCRNCDGYDTCEEGKFALSLILLLQTLTAKLGSLPLLSAGDA